MPPIVEDGTYDLVTHTRTNARSRTLEHTDARTDSHILTDTHARTHAHTTYVFFKPCIYRKHGSILKSTLYNYVLICIYRSVLCVCILRIHYFSIYLFVYNATCKMFIVWLLYTMFFNYLSIVVCRFLIRDVLIRSVSLSWNIDAKCETI